MISRYEVKLNNVSMASLSEKILILDVNYETPKYTRNLFQRANRNGALVGKAYKQRAAVSIVFEIHEYNISDRQTILANIIKWAKDGGDLRINDRPGQKLICVCDALPAIESVRDWTGSMTITFAAYAIPYWQNVTAQTFSAELESGTEADYDEDGGFVSTEIIPDGNAPYSFIDVTVRLPMNANPGNRIEMENSLSKDGRFVLDRTLGVVPPKQISSLIMATDDDGIFNTYMHIYVPDPAGYEDSSLGMMIKGKNDEIRLVSGKSNIVRIRYGQYRSDGNTFTPYAALVDYTVRGLWE